MPRSGTYDDATSLPRAITGSPEQIAGWLTHTYPNDPNLHVSHETIYRSLFIQGGLLQRVGNALGDAIRNDPFAAAGLVDGV